MFGLGFGELLVILVVVLLVFGPEKLPEIARTMGKTMAELRRTMDDVKHELTVPRLDEYQAPAQKPAEPSSAAPAEPPPAESPAQDEKKLT